MTTLPSRKARLWLAVPVAFGCLVMALAALVVPSHDGPPRDARLAADVATVRNAIALYAAEHDGSFPGPDAAEFTRALTTYTHLSGATGTADEARFAFRRYLVSIPPCPVGLYTGTPAAYRVFISFEDPLRPDSNEPAGWVYNPRTGEFIANEGARRRPFGRY